MFCKRQLIAKDVLRCPNPDVPDWMNVCILTHLLFFWYVYNSNHIHLLNITFSPFKTRVIFLLENSLLLSNPLP